MIEEVLSIMGISFVKDNNHILNNVSFNLYKGEMLGIIGINGVGKSTLAKILAGLEQPDSGKIFINQQEIRFALPIDAIGCGVGYVGEYPSLLPNLTVTENLFIGINEGKGLFTNKRQQHKRARTILNRFGFRVNERALAGALSFSSKKMVQIVRQFAKASKLLVLDDVAEGLSPSEVENLFDIITTIKNNGIPIICISHNYKTLLNYADRILIMRDGALTAEFTAEEIEEKKVVRAIYDREDAENWESAKDFRVGEKEIFRVQNYSMDGLFNISFSVKEGEILGITGLAGSGRTKLVEGLFGLHVNHSGLILIDGHRVSIRSPRDAIKNGLVLCMEDRTEMLLVDKDTLLLNMSLNCIDRIGKFGIISRRRERLFAQHLVKLYGIDKDLGQLMREQNKTAQNKVALAKSMATNPKILIFDEPTREFDIEAKKEFMRTIRSLRRGRGIILVFSDMDYMSRICDRVIVMDRGRIIGEVAGAPEEDLLLQILNQKEGNNDPRANC